MRPVDALWERVNDPALPPLERAKASQDLRVQLRTLSHVLAAAARDEGHTWAEIGEVLEITRQAAQQRFSSSTEERDTAQRAPELVDLLGAMADYFDARRECNEAADEHAAAGEHSFDYWGREQIDAVDRAYKRVQDEWEKVFGL